MRLGYAHISLREDPVLVSRQLQVQLGAEKVYLDAGSGSGRPQRDALLDFMREGDVLAVPSFSSFARTTHELLELMSRLAEKRVEFSSLQEGVDTSRPGGNVLWKVMDSLRSMDRGFLLQQRREGVERARQAGKYRGRKPIQVDERKFTAMYNLWKKGQMQPREMILELGMSRNTFYRKVKEYELRHGLRETLD